MNSFHLDLESKSEADLKKVGAYRYAEDRSTRILMLAISKNDGPVYLWVNPAYRFPGCGHQPESEILLLEMASDPFCLVYAWNAQFERAVLRSRALLDIGILPPKPEQMRCVAAMSRRAAMPGKLEDAAKAFGVTNKDKEGGKLINVFCKPKKDRSFNDPNDPKFQGRFAGFGRYNIIDVVVEKELHSKLKSFELKGDSLKVFQLDALINDNGLPVNVAALRNAQRILDEVDADLSAQFYSLTGLSPTQKQAVKDLLQTLGVDIEDMKGDTLKAAISHQEIMLEFAKGAGADGMEASVEHNLRILHLYADLNFAAAKKVTAMLACVCSDGRVRGSLLYYGAATGRWSGRLIQPQNFKRPTFKETAEAYDMICAGCSRRDLEMIFGNALEAIASCIRHFIQWPGGMMFDADYSQIEARIVCWLAGQTDVLEVFRSSDQWTGQKKDNPHDIYKNMASEIYGVPVSKVSKDQRTVGKHTVLGCGFAMWWPKFVETCAKFKVVVSDELAKRAVLAYRKMCSKVVDLWESVEIAARAAIENPGKRYTAGKLSFVTAVSEGVNYLILRLPSSRNIVYPWPKLEWTWYDVKDEKGEVLLDADGKPVRRQRKSITFYGKIESKAFWGRIKTYGGKLTENATQGCAADFMGHGSCVATERGFEIPILIHDQALGLQHPGQTIEDFVEALTDLPEWAQDFPLNADGDVVPYYTKEL